MKAKTVIPIVLSGVVSLGIITYATINQAQTSDNYFCAQYQEVWTTFIKDTRGDIPLINWQNNQIKNWPPRSRCLEVSQRFQRLSDNRSLNHIVRGNLNREPVLCGVKDLGDNCTNDNLLLTLPRDRNPDDVINQLLDVGRLANSQPVDLSSTNNCTDSVENYHDNKMYYSICALVKRREALTKEDSSQLVIITTDE